MTNDHSYITEISFHFFFIEGVDYGKDFNSYLCEHNKIFVPRSNGQRMYPGPDFYWSSKHKNMEKHYQLTDQIINTCSIKL